jgi:glucose-6-phosphate isomerase
VRLSLYNDQPSSEPFSNELLQDNLPDRLKTLVARANRKGLGSLDPSRSKLVRIGTETDASGAVVKSGYGVFELSWETESHPEWPELIEHEAAEIRRRIQEAHGTPLRFVIWAGMGGSAEDKHMYNALGLLKRGPRVYVLDSTDPAKLKAILDDMSRRSDLPLATMLKSTLVGAMAMGMTSYEPVVNIEKLGLLYDKAGVDATANFLYMTLPGSILDRCASSRGYQRVPLQTDDRNSVAGRHSAPLTRGSLYPLALCGVNLKEWMEAARLSEADIDAAWRLAAFLHAQIGAGRDKITLMLPKTWAGAGLWTKQNFEESLGKSEQWGVKILIDEKTRLPNYRAPKDAAQDRAFLAVHLQGAAAPDAQKASLVRRAGYPLAVLTLPRGTLASGYMQFIHNVVFGLACLRDTNFVTQPGVELYKEIAGRLHLAAGNIGGIENTREWREMRNTQRRETWRGLLTLFYDRIHGPPFSGATAPEIYAALIKKLAASREIEYGELTFFGDMRYGARGRALRAVLNRAAERIFRGRLKMGADVYEGPAMNHSYHEMIIGHGKCFSTTLIADEAESMPLIDYTADYHRSQFLATILALAERKRPVAAIALKDLSDATLRALDEFMRQAAKHVTL